MSFSEWRAFGGPLSCDGGRIRHCHRWDNTTVLRHGLLATYGAQAWVGRVRFAHAVPTRTLMGWTGGLRRRTCCPARARLKSPKAPAAASDPVAARTQARSHRIGDQPASNNLLQPRTSLHVPCQLVRPPRCCCAQSALSALAARTKPNLPLARCSIAHPKTRQ